jgi:hypothetical protein
LTEMGHAWRAAKRECDRSSANRIEEIALRAIPRHGVGRVSDWLGPVYFSHIVPVTEGVWHEHIHTHPNPSAHGTHRFICTPPENERSCQG